MSNKPIGAPSYLSMDGRSPWHVGALHAMAFESITISSRLRSSRGTLQNLEEIFNSTGKRRTAKLELSIANSDVLAESSSEQIAQAEKVGSTVSQRTSEAGGDQLTEFDIDMFTKDYRIGNSKSRKEHVFGRAEASRGEWSLAEDRDPHERFADGPTMQRYVASRTHLFSPHALMCQCSLAFLLLAPLTELGYARGWQLSKPNTSD